MHRQQRKTGNGDDADTMEFTATCADLRDAVRSAGSVCSPTAELLAYTGVFIETTDEGVRVCGSNGGLSIVANVNGAVTGSHGNAVVVPGPVVSLLGNSPGADTARVSGDEDGNLSVTVGGNDPYRFRGLAVTFPPPLSVMGSYTPIGSQELADAVSVVDPVQNQNYPGVSLRSSAAGTRFAATDGYALHVASLTSGFGDFDGLVPPDVIADAVKAKADRIAIDTDGRLISLRGHSVTVTARLMQTAAGFPAVDSFLDASHPINVTVDAKAIREALKRLAAFGSGTLVRIVASNDGSALMMSVDVTDLGSGTETVPVEGDGTGINFAADRSILSTACAVHTGDTTLSWTNSTSAIRLTSGSQPHRTTVVMPVRIPEP